MRYESDSATGLGLTLIASVLLVAFIIVGLVVVL